jgi:hypothetical protein
MVERTAKKIDSKLLQPPSQRLGRESRAIDPHAALLCPVIHTNDSLQSYICDEWFIFKAIKTNRI